MPDEESCRTHSLFTHGKLLPRCESKAYFSHIERIEAARRLYNDLRKTISDRERNNKSLATHTRSIKNAFEYGYEIESMSDVVPTHLIQVYKDSGFKRQFRNQCRDIKNLVVIESVLRSDGILVEVDGL